MEDERDEAYDENDLNPIKKNNTLPLFGNKETMNINNMIITNIRQSRYFKTDLFELKTFHQVVDEIYYRVTHLEPWEKNSRKLAGQVGMCAGVRGVAAGGIVSTPYCLLFKLFTLKLTRKQVNVMLNHMDSPYIRGLGFMYIRYCQPPNDFLSWFDSYLQDEEEIDLKAGGGYTVTIGQMCRMMLTKMEWFGTMFPRISVNVQKEIQERLEYLDMKFNLRNDAVNNDPADNWDGAMDDGSQHPVTMDDGRPSNRSRDDENVEENNRHDHKRRSRSPRKRSRSPRKRSRSPRKRSRSPRRRSRSPRKRSKSPRKRSRSPRKRSKSPRKRSRSPRKRSKSPRKRSRSPRKRSKSPRKRSRSPRKRSRSPRKRSRSPRKRSRSPRKRSRSPRKRSRSPRKRSRSPRKHSKSPRKHSRSRKRSKSQSPRNNSHSSPCNESNSSEKNHKHSEASNSYDEDATPL